MPKLRSPASIALVAAYLAVALLFALVWTAARFPNLGVRFERAPHGVIRLVNDKGVQVALLSPGDPVVFSQDGVQVRFRVGDLTAGHVPGPRLGEVRQWYGEQSRLMTMARRGTLRMTLPNIGRRLSLTARPGGMSALPGEFWFLIAGGAVAWLIGAWIWALRPRDWGAITYGLGALGFLASTWGAAGFDARDLAAPAGFLWAMTVLNYLGTQLGFWGLAAIFMNFPRQVVRPRLWHLAIPLIIVAAAAAGTAFFGLKLVFRSMFLAFLIGVVFIIAQWRVSRRDPVARAALGWMGLTTLLGSSIGVALLILPRLAGGEQVANNGVSAVPLFLSYGALALGVGRYRLFDLDRWAYRILTATIAAVLLMALDAALVLVLQLAGPAALSVSVIVVAIGYLPLRGAIWRLMAGPVAAIDGKLFQAAAEVAFTPGAAARKDAWRALLMSLFDALEAAPAAGEVDAPEVRADGLALALPPTAGEGALILRYPGKGRRLFNSGHVTLARELIAFMNKAETARDAYRRGVMEERGRIAQDLHDDVGARLLTSLHRPDVDQVRADVRDAMTDIRTIVAGLAGEAVTLEAMMAELRREAAGRLEDGDVALVWPSAPWPDTPVNHAVYRNLRSALREVVSNILRHSRARRVEAEARLSGETLTIVLRDDGVGLTPRAPGERQGHGLGNLKRRLAPIGGEIDIVNAEPGVRVEIRVALG